MALWDKLFGPPDKEQFARLVAEAIRQAGETAPLRYDPDRFRLVAQGEGTNFLNLENAYREYCAAPRDRRPAALRNFVRTWFTHRRELPTEFEDIAPDLLPGVRNRAYYELFRLREELERAASVDWPYRPVGEHLGLGLVYDLPESILQLQQQHLTDWGVGFDEALAVALRNLRERSREPFDSPAPGVWRSPWRDNYDASRLVLPDVIRRHEVRGDPVAAVPNRDTLVVTGSDDEAGLARLADLVEEGAEHPRFLSGVAVRLRGDDWVPFLPGPGHPLHDRFRLLLAKSLGPVYGEQKDLLDGLHRKREEDVFVATYSAVREKEDGRVFSYCVWSEGVDSLLPRTDRVFFFRPTGDGKGDVVAAGAWERVQEVVGDLMAPLELYPPRWRVRGFPTADQLARISA